MNNRCRPYAISVPPEPAHSKPDGYGFRQAQETGAFRQAPLIDIDGFGRQARDRDIDLSIGSSLREALEGLDRVGALRPVLFDLDNDGHVFRDEVESAPWKTYEVRGRDGYVAVHAYYSQWQLLYAREAIELGRAPVPIEWLLDEARTLSPCWREWLEHQNGWRRELDDKWRPRLSLLLRLQDRYFPTVRGTLTKTTTTLVFDPSIGEMVDPYPQTVRRFKPDQVLDELGLTQEEVKAMYDQVAWHGIARDPLRSFHDLFRMAPYRERAKLKREARRSQDAFDAAEMIRRYYHDLTGELLPRPDEMTDASDGSWRVRLYGHAPRLGYDRHDLQVALRIARLDPHIVHVVVEGKTDEILFDQLIESLTGRSSSAMGITFSNMEGVGRARLHRTILRIAKSLARFPILVADREGDIERDVGLLKDEGLLSDETTFLWDASLEEDNFTDEELVTIAAIVAREHGGRLTLTAGALREAANRQSARSGRSQKGLAEILIRLARSPEHGAVVIAKPDLSRALANFILDEMRTEPDSGAKRRPVLDIARSIILVA